MASRSIACLSLALLLASPGAIAAIPTSPATATAASELTNDHSALAQADSLFEAGSRAFRQKHPEQAMQYWHEAALLGHARAQYNLGSGYASGTGVPLDYSRAAHWWRKAALQGSTDAQYNLGVMNFEGRGMPKNYAKAMRWWYLAAMSGDPASMFRLGWMSAAGEGDEVNLADARWWWERSANLGFAPAIKALEILRRSPLAGRSRPRP